MVLKRIVHSCGKVGSWQEGQLDQHDVWLSWCVGEHPPQCSHCEQCPLQMRRAVTCETCRLPSRADSTTSSTRAWIASTGWAKILSSQQFILRIKQSLKSGLSLSLRPHSEDRYIVRHLWTLRFGVSRTSSWITNLRQLEGNQTSRRSPQERWYPHSHWCSCFWALKRIVCSQKLFFACDKLVDLHVLEVEISFFLLARKTTWR